MPELYFLRPFWLLALVPLLLLIFFFHQKKKQTSVWQKAIDEHLLEHVLVFPKVAHKKSLSRFTPVYRALFQPGVIAFYFGFLGIFALSGPCWDKTDPIQIIPERIPVVIVLNLSQSMLNADDKVSSLKKAQYKLRQLLERMPQRSISLIVFSAYAHRVMPITEDRQLIMHLLDYMTPEIMPADGNNINAGIHLARESLRKSQHKKAQILLVTDEISESVVARVNQQTSKEIESLIYYFPSAKRKQINVQAILSKTPGNTVFIQEVTSDDSDLADLILHLNKFQRPLFGNAQKKAEVLQIWFDRGPLFILLLLPVALLLFHPGRFLALSSSIISTALASLFFMYPVTSEAMTWQQLWKNSSERGLMVLKSGDAKQAEKLFSDNFWRGVAQYRQENFTTALASFSQVHTADAYYNKANTLLHLKRYQEAIISYNKALQLKPVFKEARKNLSLLEAFLQQRQQKESEFNDISKQTDKNKNRKQSHQENVSEQPKSKLTKSENNVTNTANNTESVERKHPDIIKEKELQTDNKRFNNSTQSEKHMHADTSEKSVGQKKLTLLSRKLNHNQNNSNIDKLSLAQEKTKRAPAKNHIEKSNPLAHVKKNALNVNNKINVSNDIKNVLKKNSTGDSKQKNQISYEQIEQKKSSNDVAQDNDSKIKNSRDNYQLDSISEQTNKDENLKKSRLVEEQFQSLQHWLDSIQDDPGDLLKEKFKREYKRAEKAYKAEKKQQ